MNRPAVSLVLCLLLTATAVAAGGEPAILIIDHDRGGRDYWNPLGLQEMLDEGFEVGMLPRGQTPTDEELRSVNVALVASVGGDFATDLQPKLERFMNEGGGVLVVPPGSAPAVAGGLLPLLRWLRDLGATAYLHGVLDPERRAVIDWCRWPGAPEYIWTEEIEPSPVTEGVRTLWYRTGASAYYMLLSAPLDLDPQWTPLVRTGPQSHTISWAESPVEREQMTQDLQNAFAEFLHAQGKPEGRLPLLAARDFGKGRLAVFSLHPQDFFWTGHIPALGAVTLHRGFGDRPSDGWRLLANLYRYLAEPSLNDEALGGFSTQREQLFRQVPGPPNPYDWVRGAEGGLGASYEGADPLLRDSVPSASQRSATAALPEVPRGLVGARTVYSTGRGTVRDWAQAARSAGLDFLVFLEDLAHLDAGKWEQLKADCAAASDDSFLAYPGFEFEHELGNRGYFINRYWVWPADARLFTKDGRKISTSRVYGADSGPLMLFLGYDQPVWNSTQYTLGFFSHPSNPTPPWAHRAFGSFAVFSREEGTVLDSPEQTLSAFLKLQNQKLHISPMGLALMSDPREIAEVIRQGGPFVTMLGEQKDVASLLDTGGNYCYAGRASGLCATTGPSILTWNGSYTTPYVIPRWNVAKREEDFFVLDNYRYRVRLSVASPVGLAEVLIYDGDKGVYRRFLPGGSHQFEATLDLSNDQHRHLVLVVKDTAGGVAVSGEIQTETWLNRHYLCADRCNWGTDNAGQGAYYYHPGPWTTQQGPDLMLAGRYARPVISADVLALRADLDTRFETGGAYGYMHGNPWHCYYQTWPLEEMNLHRTTFSWKGQYGGNIYFLEEYFPASIDTIWEFPKPEEPFYPECRWPEDPQAAALPQWQPLEHTLNEVRLIADVTFQEPFVHALEVTRDYVPGQGSFDFRLGAERVTGTLPDRGAPALEQEGRAPTGGLFALTGETGKRGWSWIVSGADLVYRLRAEGGKARLEVGWPAPESRGRRGTVYRSEVYGLEGEPTESALDGLLRPGGLQARVGSLTPQRVPYTFEPRQGAVIIRAADLSDIPFEWIPVEVPSLRPHATAYYRELGTDRIRPIGVDPQGVGRVVLWRGQSGAEVFIGHPILCSDPEIRYDAVRLADGQWIVDVNNATDRNRSVAFSWNPAWPGRGAMPGRMSLSRGGRASFTVKEVPHE